MATLIPFAPPQGTDKVNVLLVDDRPDKLIALESILADGGQNVLRAHSGQEALRHLLRHDVAVILLDVNMPQMDGFETAALIRERQRSEKTPIIFLTAVSDAEAYAWRGYSLGAVDYIQMPVPPEVLKAKVGGVRGPVREDRAGAPAGRVDEGDGGPRARPAPRRSRRPPRPRDPPQPVLHPGSRHAGIADIEGRVLQLNPSWTAPWATTKRS
jgi:CheY-like chemotaxis protein